jgi:phage terminase small subunit
MSADTPEQKPPRKHPKPPTLSAREIRFAQLRFQYGKRGQTKAYLEAGFSEKETADATAAAASRLVKKRHVQEYLRHLRKVAADAAKVTIEELAALVSAIAHADVRRLMTRTGEFLPLDQWPDDVAIAVESIESEEILEPVPGEKGKKRLKGYTRKVKLAGKMSAATRLMEWKQMVGQKKEADKGKSDPLVVGGEAKPDVL